MVFNLIFLIIGFIVLIKAADEFVESSSNLAKNLKISEAIIGLVIVGFGTSAPELAVSINAHLTNEVSLLFGNAIGSNILNILLILGITVLIFPVKVDNKYLKRDIPFLILIGIIFSIFFATNIIPGSEIYSYGRIESIILLILFTVFMYITIKKTPKAETEKPKYGLLLSIVIALISLVGIILGSYIVVKSASGIASSLGISKKIIGLTIVAFGTSLPELVTAVMAAKKKKVDLLLGNIIGSNIFNLCIVLGLPIVIFGGISVPDFNIFDIIINLITPIILFMLIFKNKQLSRLSGAILLIIFAIYYGNLIFGM